MTDEERRISEVERKTTNHEKDLYYGNGRPSMMVRMQQQEDGLKVTNEKLERQGRLMQRIQWLLVTTLAAVIVELIHGFSK